MYVLVTDANNPLTRSCTGAKMLTPDCHGHRNQASALPRVPLNLHLLNYRDGRLAILRKYFTALLAQAKLVTRVRLTERIVSAELLTSDKLQSDAISLTELESCDGESCLQKFNF